MKAATVSDSRTILGTKTDGFGPTSKNTDPIRRIGTKPPLDCSQWGNNCRSSNRRWVRSKLGQECGERQRQRLPLVINLRSLLKIDPFGEQKPRPNRANHPHLPFGRRVPGRDQVSRATLPWPVTCRVHPRPDQDENGMAKRSYLAACVPRGATHGWSPQHSHNLTLCIYAVISSIWAGQQRLLSLKHPLAYGHPNILLLEPAPWISFCAPRSVVARP